LALKVNQTQSVVPELTALHLSSSRADNIPELFGLFVNDTIIEAESETLKGDANLFSLTLRDFHLPPSTERKLSQSEEDEESVAQLIAYGNKPPTHEETPMFNHSAFYETLDRLQADRSSKFGRLLMYAEVVTSTNTILEKNFNILRHLPTGFTFTATVQVSGRGRGSNVWVSPAGSLMFSTVIRHSMQLSKTAPVVFIQYLAAIAIVEGILSYDVGYDELPIKLKWPNDVCKSDSLRNTSTDSNRA
jgi:biotin--protein ligase